LAEHLNKGNLSEKLNIFLSILIFVGYIVAVVFWRQSESQQALQGENKNPGLMLLWIRAEVFTIPAFFVYLVMTMHHYKIYKARRMEIHKIRVKHFGVEQLRGLAASFKTKIAAAEN